MVPILDWIGVGVGVAVAIGILGVITALVCRRLSQKARRRLRQVQLDLQNTREELNDARRRLKELQDGPQLPSDLEIASHLSALGTRIVDCIIKLDGVRVGSAEPFRQVAEEAEQSRTVSRRERFSSFRNTLEEANVQISMHIERLLAAHPLISALEQMLKSGHLSPVIGNSEIASIGAVLKALDQEVSLDDAWRDAIRNRIKEFEPIVKAREKRRDLDRRQREEQRLAAANAFNRYKLPPLTPFEKFLALKSTGRRDGFG